MWFEGNPCNMHLLDLAEEVKKVMCIVHPLLHHTRTANGL